MTDGRERINLYSNTARTSFERFAVVVAALENAAVEAAAVLPSAPIVLLDY